MSATATPNNGLPSNAPTEVKEWTSGSGERRSIEWRGTREQIDDEYDSQKALALAGENIAQVISRNTGGRATLLVTYGRTGSDIGSSQGDEVSVIEELYSVDVNKDIYNAPYFYDGGTGALTDDQILTVRNATDNTWSEAEITANATASTWEWANWTDAMKDLRYHISHGQTTYVATDFVFRRSWYGIKTSQITLNYSYLNKVYQSGGAPTTPPIETVGMANRFAQLPTLEWLQKASHEETLGNGRWRWIEEYWGSEKWSVVYGGTWNRP